MKKRLNKVKTVQRLKRVSNSEFTRYVNKWKLQFFRNIKHIAFEREMQERKMKSITILFRVVKSVRQKHFYKIKTCKRRRNYGFFLKTLFQRYDNLRRAVITKKQTQFLRKLCMMRLLGKQEFQLNRMCSI